MVGLIAGMANFERAFRRAEEWIPFAIVSALIPFRTKKKVYLLIEYGPGRKP